MNKLDKILSNHKLWLQTLGKSGAKADLRRADLRRADLSYADLSNANLSYADLSNADLRLANLSYADLSNADLRLADLSNANLINANLRRANLSYADLSNADLSNANLSNADLSNADLRRADLSYADLSNADLSNAKIIYKTLEVTCHQITGWKNLYTYYVMAYKAKDMDIIKMGCHTRTTDEWLSHFWNNDEEFPNNNSPKSNMRLAAFNFAMEWIKQQKNKT
jgi:hypothetical protein